MKVLEKDGNIKIIDPKSNLLPRLEKDGWKEAKKAPKEVEEAVAKQKEEADALKQAEAVKGK